MTSQQTILVLLLLVVIVFGAGFLWWMQAGSLSLGRPSATQTPGLIEVNSTFNLGVLQRTEYTRLDHSPIQEGAIPVQAPTLVGKPNPFL
jgi:hypothetical protein